MNGPKMKSGRSKRQNIRNSNYFSMWNFSGQHVNPWRWFWEIWLIITLWNCSKNTSRLAAIERKIQRSFRFTDILSRTSSLEKWTLTVLDHPLRHFWNIWLFFVCPLLYFDPNQFWLNTVHFPHKIIFHIIISFYTIMSPPNT